MVKFDSDVGSFMTFDDVAVELLRMAGHSGTVPGAISESDVKAALAQLRKRVADLPEKPAQNDAADLDEDEPAPVALGTRAFALVQLLEDAAANGSSIRWRAT